MKNIEKATNNMKMVYSILCNLKKCTIFELQKLTKFRDVDLCLALGYLQTLCKYVGKLCLHAVFSCANGWSSFRKEQLFLLLKAY